MRNTCPKNRPLTPAHACLTRIVATAAGAALMITAEGNGLLAPARAVAQDRARRPNILMIYCDDHAYQAIRAYHSVCAYGLKLNETP